MLNLMLREIGRVSENQNKAQLTISGVDFSSFTRKSLLIRSCASFDSIVRAQQEKPPKQKGSGVKDVE
jgi:hypothetical protein